MSFTASAAVLSPRPGREHANTNFSFGLFSSMPVLGVWLPARLPTSRAAPGRDGALAVGVKQDLGGLDV